MIFDIFDQVKKSALLDLQGDLRVVQGDIGVLKGENEPKEGDIHYH